MIQIYQPSIWDADENEQPLLCGYDFLEFDK